MEPCKIHGTTQRLASHTGGLEGKEIPSPSSRGGKMSLTSPLIDQAIAQACAFSSPFCLSVSAIAILRQTTRLAVSGTNALAHSRLRRDKGRFCMNGGAQIDPAERVTLRGRMAR